MTGQGDSHEIITDIPASQLNIAIWAEYESASQQVEGRC